MFDSIPSKRRDPRAVSPGKVLVLFGTRPEAIKLAPVIHELQRTGFETVVVSSSQHKSLLLPFLATLNIIPDHDLKVMQRDQSPNDVYRRVVARLDKVLVSENPDMILVQGDTTTALAGAMAGFNRQVPVGHVEAGLRSGNLKSPFPEEMNRRLIGQIAKFHFAATETNRRNLLAENLPDGQIFVTGNTVVDSLTAMLRQLSSSKVIRDVIAETEGKKRILLTTHRRESFGDKLTENLKTIAEFVDSHDDVCVIFPVHPNPNVKHLAEQILAGRDRVYLLSPLDYPDFLSLMKSSWLIVSDSGGVQEEAPSLGKPLLVLRENTERPEAVAAGIARLVGTNPLMPILKEVYSSDSWHDSVRKIPNPFGDGKASARIVEIIDRELDIQETALPKPRKPGVSPGLRVFRSPV